MFQWKFDNYSLITFSGHIQSFVNLLLRKEMSILLCSSLVFFPWFLSDVNHLCLHVLHQCLKHIVSMAIGWGPVCWLGKKVSSSLAFFSFETVVSMPLYKEADVWVVFLRAEGWAGVVEGVVGVRLSRGLPYHAVLELSDLEMEKISWVSLILEYVLLCNNLKAYLFNTKKKISMGRL